MAGDSAAALSALWYLEERRALDTIAPECSIPNGGRRSQFDEELRSMKRHGRQ